MASELPLSQKVGFRPKAKRRMTWRDPMAMYDRFGKRLALAGMIAAGASTAAGAAFLMSRGRLSLDVGWGRSIHLLGPIAVSIAAPRDLVFLREKLAVLERADDMVVAEHRTKLPWMDAITVESVRFQRPERVSFRLLRGPVPYVVEEFVLKEQGDGTLFTYRGELGADLWLLGRFYGGRVVRPAWERVVRASIEDIKAATEQRAAAHRRRPRKGRS